MTTQSTSLDFAALERPSPQLLTYYLLASLLSGPAMVIVIPALMIRYNTLRAHVGLREGLDNASELRTRILARSQTTAVLGDDHDGAHRSHTLGDGMSHSTGFHVTHVQFLREIDESTSKLVIAN